MYNLTPQIIFKEIYNLINPKHNFHIYEKFSSEKSHTFKIRKNHLKIK